MRFCTLLLLVSLALGPYLTAAANPDGARIIGAYPITGDWPFLVWLYNKTSQKPCGGVIWNAKTIVTAARCLADKEKRFIKPDDLIIYLTHGQKDIVGRHSWYEVKASKFIVHPQWKHTHADLPQNDIGLIRLATPIDFAGIHSKASCICDPVETSKRLDSYCLAMGWGVNEHMDGSKGTFPTYLRQTDRLVIRDESLCRKEDYPTYDPRMHLCAGGYPADYEPSIEYEVARISLGDDGGPLLCQLKERRDIYTYAGIALPVKTDNKLARSFFLDVLPYRNWIMANAPDEDDDDLPTTHAKLLNNRSNSSLTINLTISSTASELPVEQSKVLWIIGIAVALILSIAGTFLCLALCKKQVTSKVH